MTQHVVHNAASERFAATRRLRAWRVPAALMLLSLVPALAGTARLLDLAGGVPATPDTARFHALPWPILLHIPAALVYSVLGAMQFSDALRREHRRWHRYAGRVLIPLAFVVAMTGLWMTLVYEMPAVDRGAVRVERLLVGAAMLLFLALGVRAVVERRYTVHGEWMIRAYALGMGAGTQVLTHLPWFILVDLAPPETPRAIMMGIAWVINAAVAEWVIWRARHLASNPVARRIGSPTAVVAPTARGATPRTLPQ